MKKVLVIAIAVMLVIGMTSAASAQMWRVNIETSSSTGMNPGPQATFGQAANPATTVWTAPDSFGTLAHVAIERAGTAYGVDVHGGGAALNDSWTVRVIASGSYTPDHIMVRLFTLGHPSTLPLEEFDEPIWFQLTMVNNQGVAGAPAVGTSWIASEIPSATSTYFNFEGMPLLPALRAAGPVSSADLLNSAYEFELAVVPVPEPGSMLALGSGLVGLAGFVARRRRG